MAYVEFLFRASHNNIDFSVEGGALANPQITVGHNFVKLRPLAANGQTFAPIPFGSYQEGIIVTRNWSPTELDSMFGFVACYCLNGGSIGYQASDDDGTTWKIFDGANWVLAAGNFNTDLEIDAGIKTFPFQDGIKFRIKLTPSPDGTGTPILYLFRIFCEYRCFGMLDDLFRSWIAFLEENCTYRLIHIEDLNNTNIIEMNPRFPVIGDVKVFDLAFDQNKRDNILDTVNGQELTLVNNVTSEVEVQFKSQPSFHIMTDAGLEVSELPAVTVQFTSIVPDEMISREDEIGYDVTNKIAKIREVATRYLVGVEIKSMTHNKYRATMLSGAVRNMVEKNTFIRSLATDTIYFLLAPSSAESQEDRPTENLFVHRFEVDAEWVDWGGQQNPEEVPVVEEVNVNIWPSGNSCLEGD